MLKDFAPVTQLAASYGLALITNLPVKSVAELVALARKKPGQLTFATNGVGNVTHVAGLLFDARTGVKMIAVPYNTPNLIADVMTGQVDMAFYSVASAAGLVKAGKIRALALTGSRRAPVVPRMAEPVKVTRARRRCQRTLHVVSYACLARAFVKERVG